MAILFTINDREKRASVAEYDLPYTRAWPLPDGEIDQQDRAHIAGLYAGIVLEPELRPWRPVAPQTGDWTDITPGTSDWTDVPPASGSWTPTT